jgi:hypothetical protein
MALGRQTLLRQTNSAQPFSPFSSVENAEHAMAKLFPALMTRDRPVRLWRYFLLKND